MDLAAWCFTIAIAVGTWNQFSLIRQCRREMNKVDQMRTKFIELQNLMWDHGRFNDSNGKSFDPYNVDEVSEKWAEYQRILRQFHQASRGENIT